LLNKSHATHPSARAAGMNEPFHSRGLIPHEGSNRFILERTESTLLVGSPTARIPSTLSFRKQKARRSMAAQDLEAHLLTLQGAKIFFQDMQDGRLKLLVISIVRDLAPGDL
jgi:hypothetical protein